MERLLAILILRQDFRAGVLLKDSLPIGLARLSKARDRRYNSD
jgi:hypothetical protein